MMLHLGQPVNWQCMSVRQRRAHPRVSTFRKTCQSGVGAEISSSNAPCRVQTAEVEETFRIDHYLGKKPVQDVPRFRFPHCYDSTLVPAGDCVEKLAALDLAKYWSSEHMQVHAECA